MIKKIILLILLFSSTSFAGTKVLDYGFEDWTGDADTTPGYIFTASAQVYWDRHEAGTHVVSNCDGDTAHSGTYYWRRNYYTGAYDSCLGSTPTSENSRNNIGYNGSYPDSAYGSSLNIGNAVTSSVITVRFYFRLGGNWPCDGINGDTKFFRLYGAGNPADDTNSMFCNLYESATGWRFLDYGNGSYYLTFGTSDLDDGNWHSLTVVVERLNDTNSNPNVEISAWIDDWDMSGAANRTSQIWQATVGDAFSYLAIMSNWGDGSPTQPIWVDMDDIEIWDGLPDETTASVSISASDTVASEVGPATGSITVSCTGDGCGSASVDYTMTGTATDTTDYNDNDDGTIVTFPTTVIYTPIGDEACEGLETIISSLVNCTNCDIGTPNSETIYIADDSANDCVSSDGRAGRVYNISGSGNIYNLNGSGTAN